MPSIKEAKAWRLKTLTDAYDLITLQTTKEAASLRQQFEMAMTDIRNGWETARTVRALDQARLIVHGDGK